MNKELYVVGSANVDLNISAKRVPEKGETIRGENYFEMAGGKGANQAVSASLLGIPTYMIANIGDDLHGKYILKNFENFNVDTKFVNVDSQNYTGLAMIIKSDNDNRIILDLGANNYLNQDNIDKALKNAKSKDFMLTQLENDINTVIYSLKSAKEKNLTTIFNPAPAEILPDEIYKFVDYIIINESEAKIISGITPKKKNDFEKISKVLIDKGVKACVITLGEKGSVYIDKDNYIFTKSKSIEIIDTTGAGDAFIGAFISGIMQEKEIFDVLEFANAVGAFMCKIDGAQSKELNIENINKFMEG